jgi:hypothetical protein
VLSRQAAQLAAAPQPEPEPERWWRRRRGNC